MLKLDACKAMDNQAQMNHFDAIQHAMRNFCVNDGGIVIGTGSAAKVKITNTVNYLADGIWKAKTTAEVDFTATAHDIAASATLVQEALYLLMLAADGTPSLVMGTIASGLGNAKLPEVPATGCPIGAVRVAVAAGATPFDASTDLLSASHLTDTYYSFGGPLIGRFDAIV